MLNARLLEDDEPPVLDKQSIDRRNIQRKCLRHWDTVFHMLVDMYGWPLGCVHLNPNYVPSPNGRIRGAGGPRLVGFKGRTIARKRWAHGFASAATGREAIISSSW